MTSPPKKLQFYSSAIEANITLRRLCELTKRRKNYSYCQFCGEGFRNKLSWRAHEKKHSVEYQFPFPCGMCEKRFRTLKLFHIHQKSTCNGPGHQGPGQPQQPEEPAGWDDDVVEMKVATDDHDHDRNRSLSLSPSFSLADIETASVTSTSRFTSTSTMTSKSKLKSKSKSEAIKTKRKDKGNPKKPKINVVDVDVDPLELEQKLDRDPEEVADAVVKVDPSSFASHSIKTETEQDFENADVKVKVEPEFILPD